MIRFCLSSAYVFLFLNSILGAPLWGSWEIPNKIQLDGILWATLNLYVHITTVVRLLRDEQQVKLDKNQQALWRMFFRIGGLSQKIFQKTIARHCEVVSHNANEKLDVNGYFYILYKGAVQLSVSDDHTGTTVSVRRAQSGQIFDFRALGLLERQQDLTKHRLEAVVAISNVTLFRFPRQKMPSIANHPSTRLLWKELLMENMLRIVQRYFDERMRQETTHMYVNPMFRPLKPWEESHPLRAGSGKALRHPVFHLLASMKWSFAPPWPFQGPPEGLRHNQLLVGRRFSRGDGVVTAPNKTMSLVDKDGDCSINYHKTSHPNEERYKYTDESVSLLGMTSIASNGKTMDESFLSMTSGEDEAFLEYIHEIDEEIGTTANRIAMPPSSKRNKNI